jgi:TPR repeat protein
LLFFFFLILGVADAQQTNSFTSITNGMAFKEIVAKAEKGDSLSQCSVGETYWFGTSNVPVDKKEAVKWLLRAAEQGNEEAEYNLAGSYHDGEGVERNDIEAAKWWRKAAEHNLKEAQYALGSIYRDGIGVPKDSLEALKWFQKAAEQGFAPAQECLGNIYSTGRGVNTNYNEAIKWYRKSAEQGRADSQLNLWDLYSHGIGVETNYDEAIKWLRMAAEQGNAEAQNSLAAHYALGIGVPKDYAEKFKWDYKAADQGDVGAQNRLGFSYLTGCGISKDNISAYKWFNLAAARGNQDAKTQREELEQQMTGEQVAEAQKLTREYKPGASVNTTESHPKEAQQEPQLTGNGTGFFITEDGYLITNYHVVKDAGKVRLLTSAGLLDATVVKVDAANDLALLKVMGRFDPLSIAASRAAKLGGTVATVGFPNIGMQGAAPKLAKGEIASLSGAGDDPRYFQISVPVQPGNLGGALVDERGNVIGIVSAKLNASAALAASGALPENVNYAVKSSLLLSFLESVPEVDAKLKSPVTADRKFEEVVRSAQNAAVLVLVY